MKNYKIKPISIADQIAIQLKEALVTGEYRAGEQLPPVAELARRFSVGVSSVREALKKLEALELVEIIHGRGVFVRSAKMQWQARFTNFSEMVRQWGKIPGAKLLESESCAATMHLAAQLGLHEGAAVHRLKRVRLADDEPIAVETSYLPADRFPNLLRVYRDPMSLYQLLLAEYHVKPTNALQILEAKLMDMDDAHWLNVHPGSPALLVDTIAYDADSIPIEYGVSIFRADKYKYVVRLSR